MACFLGGEVIWASLHLGRRTRGFHGYFSECSRANTAKEDGQLFSVSLRGPIRPKDCFIWPILYYNFLE